MTKVGDERRQAVAKIRPPGIPHGDEELGGAMTGGVAGVVSGAVIGGAVGAASGVAARG